MPDDYYVSQYSGEEIDALLGGAGAGTVRYDAAQTLTDAQKTQARGNIAAAPDGFGLGANGYPNPYTVVTGATIDALNESGLFWYRDPDTPIYPDGYNSGTAGNLLNIVGSRENTLAARQIFYPCSPYGDTGALNISCMRMRTGVGEWQPWEWVNPPMQLGVEYRTTERFLGKPVYVKVVNCGQISDGKEVEHGISGMKRCISAQGLMSDLALPMILSHDLSNVWSVYISLVDRTKIRFECGTSNAGNNIAAILKYTKTTD